MQKGMRTRRLILSGLTLVVTGIAGTSLLAFGIIALLHGDSHGVAGLVFGSIVLSFAALDIYVIRLIARSPAKPSAVIPESPPGV